jgi:hypothetical protein
VELTSRPRGAALHCFCGRGGGFWYCLGRVEEDGAGADCAVAGSAEKAVYRLMTVYCRYLWRQFDTSILFGESTVRMSIGDGQFSLWRRLGWSMSARYGILVKASMVSLATRCSAPCKYQVSYVGIMDGRDRVVVEDGCCDDTRARNGGGSVHILLIDRSLYIYSLHKWRLGSTEGLLNAS